MYTLIIVILSLRGPAIATVPGFVSSEACETALAKAALDFHPLTIDDGREFSVTRGSCVFDGNEPPSISGEPISDVARKAIKEFLETPIDLAPHRQIFRNESHERKTL